jgi:hypothetical protein
MADVIEHLVALIVVMSGMRSVRDVALMTLTTSCLRLCRTNRRRAMTTLAKLIAQRQQLEERLDAAPGQHERDELRRLLEKIDAALQALDESGPGTSQDDD